MIDSELQQYIYEHIPIVKTSKFLIHRERSGLIFVTADLHTHYNHQMTAFGGSLSTALTLAAWANVRDIALSTGRKDLVVVIQSQQIRFSRPVSGDFSAHILPIAAGERDRFTQMLMKSGKAGLSIEGEIRVSSADDSESPDRTSGADAPCSFTGDFVAIIPSGD